MDRVQMLTMLRRTEFFRSLPASLLTELFDKLMPVSLKSGDVLFNEGDSSTSMYIVLHGRLKVFKAVKNQIKSVAEIGQGDIVGEFAFLTQLKRSATLIAIRDTHLLELTTEQFQQILLAYPADVLPLWRSALKRSISLSKENVDFSASISPIKTISIFPRDESNQSKATIDALSLLFSSLGSTLNLDEATLDSLLSLHGDLSEGEIERRTIAWLSDQEYSYRYLLYKAKYEQRPEPSSWYSRCLRQADAHVIVAVANDSTDLAASEIPIFEKNTHGKNIHLVVVFPNGQNTPYGAENWLNARPNANIHHVRLGNRSDLERVCRAITGNARGLALAGGGCKAYAHLGVYKALKELGIEIDHIGGSSGGACIGSVLATDISPDDAIAVIKEKFVSNPKALSDYTFPLISLISGKEYERRVKAVSGIDTLIENLWIPFFAVACNVNTSSVQMLDRGLLWKAVRASSSLPAVFPPVFDDNGNFLTDGGVVNNLPVDLLRNAMQSGIIIASSFEREEPISAANVEGGVSGWKALYDTYVRKTPSNYPSITETIVKACWVASVQHAQKMAAEADIFIASKRLGTGELEWTAIDRMIEAGYAATMEQADAILLRVNQRSKSAF